MYSVTTYMPEVFRSKIVRDTETHANMHTHINACWQTIQTPLACSLYIVQEYQAAPYFSMFFSIYMRFVCFCEWVGVWVCLSMCVFEYVCRHVGAFPCLRRNSDTGTLCWKCLFLPSYRRLEGGSEGGRCRKVGASERGRSMNTHQSLNKHLKTTAESLPGRLCMLFCIYFCATWALTLAVLIEDVSLRDLTTVCAE